MSVVFADDWLTVHHGDARAVLPTLAAASIDAVVTSPPYWRQRSYLAADDPLKPLELGSEETFEEWVSNLVGLCHELKRVLVPAGSLWMVLGDRYVAHGGPYSQPGHIGIRQGERDGTAFARHVPRRTTLRGFPEGVRRKSLLLAPYRFAIAMCDDGWILRDRIVWAKTNGLPESVQDRLHARDEVVFRFTLREKAYFDVDAIREAYAIASIARAREGRAPTFAGAKHAAPGGSRHGRRRSGRAARETLTGPRSIARVESASGETPVEQFERDLTFWSVAKVDHTEAFRVAAVQRSQAGELYAEAETWAELIAAELHKRREVRP